MKLYESNLGGGQFICRETCWCIWLGEIFCSQKKKQAVSLVDFGKSTGLFGGAISFLPLF